MRRIANIAIIAAFLGWGIQYALGNSWWVVLACGLMGFVWLLHSRLDGELSATISLLFLAGIGGVGIFLNFNPVWLLTNLVVTLIAWDLDRFDRDFQQFSMGQADNKDEPALFRAHLKRLGFVALLGWGLGLTTLNVQVSLNFAGALILGSLVLLGFRQVVAFLRGEDRRENA